MVYGEDKPSLFVNIPDATRTQFETEMLLLLDACNQPTLVTQLENFIADIAASLYNEEKEKVPNNKKWPHLIQHLLQLYAKGEK